MTPLRIGKAAWANENRYCEIASMRSELVSDTLWFKGGVAHPGLDGQLHQVLPSAGRFAGSLGLFVAHDLPRRNGYFTRLKQTRDIVLISSTPITKSEREIF